MSNNDENKGFGIDEILQEYGSEIKRELKPIIEPELIIYPKKTAGGIGIRKEICDWLEHFLLCLVFVVLIITFVARVNQVYGYSMEPTLYEGNRLIVTPVYTMPGHGDIVVVKADHLPNSKTGQMGEPIVKRVIGLPGDVIDIDKETGEVYRNGTLLDEKYIAEKIHPDKVGNQVYPLVIKEGHVFIMGDNRNHSSDSRVEAGAGVVYYVGMIEKGSIIGKAILRIYPFDVFGSLK